ncbi:hypothetical protein EDB59_0088 [Vibrio crassostreae]|uniref:hypothetical protein n=1 Tax=Vibrio crassostreae TaxID=246167 RepID=UPI000FA98016|nr:hypothetical protein [Vibrio crassostreae]ROR69460.1 hypothetical protein EDB59_0088 [Vibrio crassostreae]
MDALFPNNNINDGHRKFFRSTMLALLTNAARKKVANLPAHFRWDKDVANEIVGSSPLSHCYPKLPLEILCDSSEKRRESFKGYFSSRFHDIDIKYTSLTSNTSFIARYMLCRGIETFEEMTPESFADFRIESYLDRPTSDIPWKIVCDALERKGILPKGWVEQCSEVHNKLKPKAVELVAQSTGVVTSNRNGYLSNTFGEFCSMSKGAQNKELGSIYKNGVKLLYTPNKAEGVAAFGDFTLSRNLSDFSPQNIPDSSYWKRAQTAWTDLTDIERGTAKSRTNSLQYLNAYIYGYLPWFYKKHPNCHFDYPDTPSKFFGSVFVKTDPVLDNLYLLEADKTGKEVFYPISLLSFIEGIISTSNSVSGKESNTLRDTCASLRRFFETVMDRYGDIDGYKLKFNPIPKLKNVGYKRSGKTVKDTFNVGYWVVFRIFLKELAKAALFASAKEVAKSLPQSEAKNLIERRDELSTIKGFQHINEITYSKNFDKFTIPTSIDVNGKQLEIGEITLPDWSNRLSKKAVIGEKSTRVDIANYHQLLTLNVSAYAGQRSSNSANLCADTFDADYVPTNSEDPMTKQVPLRVRTDKVKVQGLESSIQEDVMMMLCYAKELRKHFSHKGFVEPIPYQDNELSVHGSFRPLLQGTSKHSGIHPNMSQFIFVYEQWLEKHGIEFESKITLTPSNLSVEQFDIVKQHNLNELTKVMLVHYEDLADPIPYSPLIPKTTLTPHSLRVQLVTVINITTGDKNAVRMFTGQTDGTIGFYTKATPKDEATLVTLKNQLNQSSDVVSVEESSVTEAMLLQMFDSIDEDGDEELPFFAGSGVALKALRESGGRGLAINYTHICPYDNKCPEEVVNEHGRMNCHECTHACITSHNKIAIAAAARKALDEIKEYSAMIISSTNNSEKRQLEMKYAEQLHIASNWLARHSYIQLNKDRFVIAGFDALKQYNYIPESDLSNGLLAKLREVSGVPSLQSQNLKRMASMVAAKISTKVQRQKLPELTPETQMMLEFDPIRYVVQNLSMLAQLKGSTPEELLTETLKLENDVPLMEELGLV